MTQAAIDRAQSFGIAAACAFACGGVAAADETAHPSGLIQSTEVEQEDGVVELYQSVRPGPGSQPQLQNQMVLRLPKAAEIRFSRFLQCRLARVQAFGPKACPRGSRVGRGVVRGSYVDDQVSAVLRLYNGSRFGGRRTLLIHVTPKLGPSFVWPGKWQTRPRGGMELHVPLRLSASFDYGPQVVYSNFTFAFRSRRGGAHFLRSPCDSRWAVSSSYSTGVVIASADATACR